jgi:hypothetical protein
MIGHITLSGVCLDWHMAARLLIQQVLRFQRRPLCPDWPLKLPSYTIKDS